MQENLVVLDTYVEKLKDAIEGKDLSVIQHYQCLVEKQLSKTQSFSEEGLEEPFKSQLSAAITEAQRVRDNTRAIVEVVIAQADKMKSATSVGSTSEIAIKWHWSAIPFHGKASEWTSWWDQFSSAIDKNRSLAPEFKMKSLMECLKGDAVETLGEVSKTGENYKYAIDKLKLRYGNPVLLSQEYYTELASLVPSSNLTTHQKVFDKLAAIVRNLLLLGGEITVDNQMLIKQILKKFPEELLSRALGTLVKEDQELTVTPQELLNAIRSMLKISNFIATYREGPDTCSLVKTTTVMATATTSKKRKTSTLTDKERRQCAFCSLWHSSVECKKFPSVKERRDRAAKENLCFNCLRRNHKSTECQLPKAVCNRCDKAHHTVFCQVKKGNKGIVTSFIGSFLQSVICTVSNPYLSCYSLEVRCLLDPGSDQSYVEYDIVKKLKLQLGTAFSLECYRFGESNANIITGHEVVMTLSNDQQESKTFKFNTTFCIANSAVETAPPTNLVVKLLPTNLQYADLDLFMEYRRPIKALIGADIYNEIVSLTDTRELPNGIRILKTFFGDVPFGGIPDSENSFIISRKKARVTYSNVTHEANSPLVSEHEVQLEQLWSLETLGIESPDKEVTNDLVLDYFKRTSYIDELGRMNVRIPWKHNVELPSNFRVALARLRRLLGTTNSEKIQLVDEYFHQQLQLGVIEEAIPEPKSCRMNSSDEVSRLHYLPHSWLFQKNKLRVVFDASAKTKTGRCLNDLIHQGPNFTENLVQLLLNFRLHAIGMMADIEKAFLQISLNEVDRNATRFLWLKDISKPAIPENLRYLRSTRVLFGVNVSPYLLNMVLQVLLTSSPEDEYVVKNQSKFYVDNFITSVASLKEALRTYEAMNAKLETIQMNLRDWVTNDARVASAIPTEKLGKNADEVSALGLLWNCDTDMIRLNLNIEVDRKVGTKRNILRFVASIYDPLGLWLPCVLDLKILVQNCWKLQYQWDTKLPPQLNSEWVKLQSDALQLSNMTVPRRYWLVDEPSEYTLHIFCDASHKAYACCAYLVCKGRRKSEMHSSLIFCKTRLAPIKKLTIPRLELMAVVIGKRVASFLIEKLDINMTKVVVWTDATTVLQWVKSLEVLPTFVQNRVSEIRKASNLCLRYVPSKDNPADLASRGKSAAALKTCDIWWQGPEWLVHEALWPNPPLNVENCENAMLSKETVVFLTTKLKNTSLLTDNIENKNRTWQWRVRILSNVIKFCFLGSKLPFHASDVEALIMAERLLIIELQRKYFPKEYTLLKKGIRPSNNLDLFLDEKGIIRCKGRLLHARFPWEMTHPMLLPRDSEATLAYIRDIHQQNGHIGVSHVLAKLREKFWIVKGRAKVRSVLHKCRWCRRWEGGRYKLPDMPPLPESRLVDVTPFLQTGLDYFGPILCKANDASLEIQVYVLIFTCLVTRAIHLELVPNMSGDHFLLALQRFCSIRRVPKLIISDNYSTFTFVQPLVGVKVAITDHKVNCELNSNRIEWYFIPQYAPWYGGAYERLIGVVKRSLKRSYGRSLLTYIELGTVLYRIADIVNSRPLTYVSSEEVVEPLTPNHFLKLGPTNVNLSLEPVPQPMLSDTGRTLMHKWEFMSGILDAYWDAFRNLYLVSLRERHLVQHKKEKGTVNISPKIGDVVLIREHSMPRSYWKIGQIRQLDKRQAVAHVYHGEKKQVLIRSIRDLYPLEVDVYRPLPDAST